MALESMNMNMNTLVSNHFGLFIMANTCNLCFGCVQTSKMAATTAILTVDISFWHVLVNFPMIGMDIVQHLVRLGIVHPSAVIMGSISNGVFYATQLFRYELTLLGDTYMRSSATDHSSYIILRRSWLHFFFINTINEIG